MKYLLLFICFCGLYARDTDLVPVIPSAQGGIVNSSWEFSLKKTKSKEYELFEGHKKAKPTGLVFAFNSRETRILFVRNRKWFAFYDPDLRQIKCYHITQLRLFSSKNRDWKDSVLSKSNAKRLSANEKDDALMVEFDDFLVAHPNQLIYSQYYPYRGNILSSFIDE